MITIDPQYDLTLLVDNFTEHGYYTKQVILEELLYWQKQPDFLCLVSTDEDGFLIGYRNGDSLWISQAWHKEVDPKMGYAAMKMAKKWSKERGIKRFFGETERSNMGAMARYGFKEYSINMVCEL